MDRTIVARHHYRTYRIDVGASGNAHLVLFDERFAFASLQDALAFVDSGKAAALQLELSGGDDFIRTYPFPPETKDF